MNFRNILVFCAVFCGVSLSGDMKISQKGAFNLGGLDVRVKCFDKNWRSATQNDRFFFMRKNDGNVLESELDMPGLKGILNQKIEKTGPDSYRYTVRFDVKEGFKAVQVALDMTARASRFEGRELFTDGKRFEFPIQVLKQKDAFNILWKRPKKVTFVLERSRVSFSRATPFEFFVQDDRATGGKTFAVRLLLSKTGPNSYGITVDLKEEPYSLMQLDLRKAFNTSFNDETPDDRKGGWTDQGADNDLRMLPCWEKSPNVGDVPFTLVPPWKNYNRSCIVLCGPFRGYFPKSASTEITGSPHGKYLYLLHTMAWPSAKVIGNVILEHADGSKTTVSVKGYTDVGNWWSPQPCRNGVVAWSGENKSAVVGLYRSIHEIPDKPVKRITFESTGASVWAVVGATLSSDRVPEKKVGGPVTVEENAEWKSIRQEKDTLPGSVLDFSSMLDAPAGKYGPVVVRNGRFEFRDRPGVGVRFYGTNLVDTAQFLDHKWSERLAERLAMSGFNIVRIHHHDNGLSVRKDGNSTDINEKNLERLNYLVYCLKKKGIYVITDCYVSRRFTEEEIKNWGANAFKSMVYLRKSALDNWKRFVKNWFTSRNPYTGLALKDDPSLVAVNLVNEGFLGTRWTGDLGKIKKEQFSAWLRSKGIKEDPKKHEELAAAFLNELYDASFREMTRFLRVELGMNKPVSDQNHHSEWLLSFLRDKYDYVDNHFYFDHPQFPVKNWALPARLENVSALAGASSDLGWMFTTRAWNKPFAITEFDYAKPNFFRAEGGVLPAAYAGLQDWNGLVQFAASHGYGNIIHDQTTHGPFDLYSDVVKLLSHRIGVKLFLGNEIKPAPIALSAVFKKPDGMNYSMVPSRDMRNLGLVAQIGFAVLPDGKADRKKIPSKLDALIDVGYNFPKDSWTIPVVEAKNFGSKPFEELIAKKILPKNCRDASGKVFRSSGGQLELDSARQTFIAKASGIDVLILPAKLSGTAGVLRVDNKVGRGVFSLQSVDGKPLKESKRMLFLHLTDSQATLLKFDNSLVKQYSTWGKAPHLAARGEADVTLGLSGDYRLFSCDTAGKRLAEVKLEKIHGGLKFRSSVFRGEGRVFVYELVRK